MICIKKGVSKKSGKDYLCLTVNGVLLFVNYIDILKIASTNGISNLDIELLKPGESIVIENGQHI